MKTFLSGLAILPFLTATAFAQPAQLNEAQMDTVTAGWSFYEIDVSNTSITAVSVYNGANHIMCPPGVCYINVYSPAISVASVMLSSGPVS